VSSTLNDILAEIAQRRGAQDRAGELLRPVGSATPAQKLAASMSHAGQQLAAFAGHDTWCGLLSLRTATACAAEGGELREELLQLGALVAAFIENLDKVAEIEADNA